MNVKPSTAILIALSFLILLITKMWAGSHWRSYGGPLLMNWSSSGHLHINLDNKIYRFDRTGDYSETIDLTGSGISRLSGGYSFFQNGDILLRDGNNDLGFFDNLRVMLRVSGDNTDRGSAFGRLMRCDTTDWNCGNLPHFSEMFSRTFRVYIDDSDTIFVADTSRHKIYWLDENGAELDSVDSGLRFPNKLVRVDDQLYVANTNRHAVSIFPIQDLQLGSPYDIEMQILSQTPAGEDWPSAVGVIDGRIYVLTQNASLLRGAIYEYDVEGNALKRFDMEENPDPVDFTILNGEILVSDYGEFQIDRYSLDGEYLGVFESEELQRHMNENAQSQRIYKLLDNAVWGLFWAFLLLGFYVAIKLEMKKRAEQKSDDVTAESNELQQAMSCGIDGNMEQQFADISVPSAEDSRIEWIYPQRAFLAKMFSKWMLGILFVFLAVSSILVLVSTPEAFDDLAFMYLFMVFLFWRLGRLSQTIFGTQLGVLESWLVAKDHRGKVGIARGADISVATKQANVIIVQDVVVATNIEQGKKIYVKEEFKRLVSPRLKGANVLTQWQYMKFIWRQKHSLIVDLTYILLAVFAMFVYLEFLN